MPLQNYDPINAQLDNMGKFVVELQPKSPLYYAVYPISEANSWTPFTLLIQLKRKILWEMNLINDGK